MCMTSRRSTRPAARFAAKPATSATAQTVSDNVWLLAQFQGYKTKAALAAGMGWDASRLSRTLSGDRQWTIEDLETAAMALNLTGPGDLFRPLAELINAVRPATNGGVTGRITGWYPAPTSDPNYRSAQVIHLRRSYQTVTADNSNAVATVTRLDAVRRGCHADTA